ncbi:MAG: hypothetical protein ACRDJN_00315, partial [Chloroflexota bacterium]
MQYDLVMPYRTRYGRLLPLLRVIVEFENGRVQLVDALLDTGADMYLMEGDVAIAAGIDPTAGFTATAWVSGVAGTTGVQAFVHRAST